MKNNKKTVKKWKLDKKQKLTKMMLFVIASFCATCCVALHIACGVILLALVLLFAYIATRPVDISYLIANNIGGINDKENKEKP